MMKKLFFSLSLLVGVLFFNACSTDVNLYADYKDIPVIYGLLDASQDTNFVRINRAFSGDNEHHIDATEVALIEDSCNYPGKLDAYIVEYKSVYANNYEPTGRIFELDTITIHNKQEGTFYSPNQKVYYTTARFKSNNGNANYRYRLLVNKGNDTIISETGIVGGENFKVITQQLSFASEPSDKTKKIKFTPADNAAFYDVSFIFFYKEQKDGGPVVDKQVKYSFGAKSKDDLDKEDVSFVLNYGENTLFNLLEAAIGPDTIINSGHPNVVRYFDEKPMQIRIAAGSDELYNFIQVNQQTGYSQTVPDYTNILGGFGVFSSRLNLVQDVKISARTQTDLYGKSSWGFVQQ